MTGWALATTSPNTEFRVGEELLKRELPHRIFKRRVRVVRRGQLTERLVPAFPRYVFVPYAKCWEVVDDLIDVTGVVTFSGRVAALVRDSVVDEIANACVGDVLIEKEPDGRFRFGEEVFVVNLIMSQRAKYHHSVGDGRTVVVIEWMGRSVFVTVNECDLCKVSEATRVCRVKRRRDRQRSTRTSSIVCGRESSRSQALIA